MKCTKDQYLNSPLLKIYQEKIKKQSEIFRKLRTLRMRIGNFRVIFLIKEKSDNLKIYTCLIVNFPLIYLIKNIVTTFIFYILSFFLAKINLNIIFYERIILFFRLNMLIIHIFI